MGYLVSKVPLSKLETCVIPQSFIFLFFRWNYLYYKFLIKVFLFLSSSHCVKSVQIRSYFWSVFSCIRTEYGDLRSRIRTRNNSAFFTQCPDCKTDGITSCIIIYVIHIHCCQPKVFRKKDVLKIFFKYSGLQACNFIKRRLQHRCFPVNIAFVLTNECFWILFRVSVNENNRKK